MRVRPARIGDGPAAIKLYAELVGPDVPVADGPLGAKRWAAIVTHSGTTVFVAEAPAGGVIGAVTLHVLPNISFGGQSYGVIENVIVTESARGQGVGRLLMDEAMKQAWKSDCHHVMLLTGHEMEATGFYEKLGFAGDERVGMIRYRD
ncbi:MAG: GNAT family N-acetyltransferase [Pseudomonadota bacterium]